MFACGFLWTFLEVLTVTTSSSADTFLPSARPTKLTPLGRFRRFCSSFISSNFVLHNWWKQLIIIHALEFQFEQCSFRKPNTFFLKLKGQTTKTNTDLHLSNNTARVQVKKKQHECYTVFIIYTIKLQKDFMSIHLEKNVKIKSLYIYKASIKKITQNLQGALRIFLFGFTFSFYPLP